MVEVRRVKMLDSRAMQILQAMQDRGWVLIKPADDDGIAEEATVSQRMTDEEFESYATELLAR